MGNFKTKTVFFKKGTTLDVVLHGGSAGVDSPFIQKLVKHSMGSGNSVVAFNFPYFERGDKMSSGPELSEELATLTNILAEIKVGKYNHIRLIGKSLGGIVASYYLNSLPPDKMKKYSLVIVGYVVGELKMDRFSGSVIVVQGEMDKFGGADKVEADLIKAACKNLRIIEIKRADHSFRNPKTKESVYEDEAIKAIG